MVAVFVVLASMLTTNVLALPKHFPPIDIQGQILDENGDPLPGASISIKGTSRGTISDAQGKFQLSQINNNSVLIISYVGYMTQEIVVHEATDTYNIALEVNPESLEEVVIVGYGTQEKEKVTGAVSQVGADVFENRPITNVAQGLQGAIPNLNISFGDGQPNRAADFNIRGITSINGGGPLILIDGTPGNVNLISPEDIESVTVLKDAASAAIYGARAAFGVILITTKKAEIGKPKIRYTSNLGWNSPTQRPRVITNSLQAAQIQNEAYRGALGTDAPGLPAVIDYLEQREADPSLPELGVDASGNFIRGANTDWYKEFYNDSAPFSKHYISLSGSEGRIGYYLSLGFQQEKGIYRTATDQYKRYNARLKLDNQVSDWLNIYNNAEFSKDNYDTPNKFVSEGGYNVYRYLSAYANPYEAIKTPDGNYTIAGVTTFGQLEKAGRTKDRNQSFKNTLGFRTNFLNNRLRVNGDYTIFINQNRYDIQNHQLEYENKPGSIVVFNTPDYYRSSFSEQVHQIINLYSEYEQNFGDHHINGIVGFNQELNQYNSFSARRNDNITTEIGAINLTTGDSFVDDNKYEWALRGVFARLNYDFKDRYLFEVQARYDGTSRFPKSDRFGFFPSVSAGWILSKEEFLQPLFNGSNILKLRASYGSLGNQLVSPYAYINTMDVYTSSNILDGALQLATSAPGLTPSNLTWETVSTFNVGFDLGVLDNRLVAGFDWYNRKTKDMLTKSKTLPAVLGTSEPQQNAADLSTKGWEFSLKWNDIIGSNNSLSYYVSVVLSDSRSFITKYDNPGKLLGDYYEGMEVGEIWGYHTLGFFKTDTEYESHADQTRVQSLLYSLDGHPLAGDIKFEDRNNDGVIDFGDNTVNSPGDRYKIGNSQPRYAYGVNMGVNWKNFSLQVFLQGIGKRDFWPGREAAVFWGFYNRWNNPVMEHIVGNYWTPENTDAYFPRLRAYTALDANTRELGVTQTRYLQDASYLRLKNVSLGYTLPTGWTESIGIANVRVFFAGANLITFSKISEAFDPEAINDDVDVSRFNGAGFVYPIQKTYTFGVEINL